jgi:alcohol dehydrogenase class IV
MTAESVGAGRLAGPGLDARPPAQDFMASTRAVVAPGRARECLNRAAAAFGEIVWAVVADRGFTDAGGLEPLLEGFAPERAPLIGLVNEDPDTDEVEELWRTARTHNAEGVIVIGGGSALCAGKAVAIRLTNDGPLSAYNGRDQLAAMPAPCLAIPTTAGSGSEVSEVVILHERDGVENLIIRGRGYAPRVAILDGELLATLPARPMVLAAVDALSHAYESLWSIDATSFTDAFAFASARTIRRTLGPSLAGDPAAHQELIEASAMANYACGNAELAAVHALASAPRVHIPHGRQTGVLVLHVAEWLSPSLRPEVADECRQIGPFYESVGFASQFTADEVDAEDREAMVQTALSHPLLGNDPVGPSVDDLREIVAHACQSRSRAHG